MTDSEIFAMRGAKVKWPTIRGAFLTDEKIEKLRRMAFGVIFLEGDYNTRLNFEKKDSVERAVFFEHLHNVEGEKLFLLCWIGNYHAGSIFHCAWQFPQMIHWPWKALEEAAFDTYKRVVSILHSEGEAFDSEVAKFVSRSAK